MGNRIVVVLLLLVIVGGCSRARADKNKVVFEKSPEALEQCPSSPNCVFSGDRVPARRIAPLRLKSKEGWNELRGYLIELPRTAIVRETPTYIHATVSSRMFGFVDDLEFLVHPDILQVDVRSSSRTGYWDFGANRRRVEKIRTWLYDRGSIRE